MEKKNQLNIREELVCKEEIIGEYKQGLNRALGRHTLWFCFSVDTAEGKIDIEHIKRNFKKESGCDFLNKKKRNYLKCTKDIDKVLESCIKKDIILSFECHAGKKGICIPVSSNNGVYAVIVICNIELELNKSTLRMLEVFKKLISNILLKESKLRQLKQTLHPRAVALSTIHTVHRIIGSTLELEELLPQIARLCLQVVRANRCTISLVDEDNKYLVPHVTVDLKDPAAKSRRVRIGAGNMGKVAQTTQAYVSSDCICLPLLNEQVMGTLTLKDKQGGKKFDIYDEEILSILAEQASVAIHNAQLYEEQKKIIVASVRSLASLLNIQIPSPYIQDIGFVEIAQAIGIRRGLNQSEINTIRYAAMLRNVVRVGIPGEILLKPDELTSSEYELIKQHSHKMVELIGTLDVLKPAVPVLLHQREKYNGTGYPSGLKGKEIPLGARIMSVVDAFEAMITSRPYKGTMSISEAVKEIRENKGTQFDPRIVDIFLELVEEGIVGKILKSHGVKPKHKKNS